VPLAAAGRPLEERAFAAAVADFTHGVPEVARSLLTELLEHDLTIATLYYRTIIEECPDMTMVEEALEDDLLLHKLRQLSFFRKWEAEDRAAGRAEGRADGRADGLIEYFSLQGDAPSVHTLGQIRACRDIAVLSGWLARAYLGEKSTDIFPEAMLVLAS
jgi:hypothetical protein